jgi:hypothetical protein
MMECPNFHFRMKREKEKEKEREFIRESINQHSRQHRACCAIGAGKLRF